MSKVARFLTLSLAICAALGLRVGPAAAQQTGGVLKFFHRDSPASMSIHEEATIFRAYHDHLNVPVPAGFRFGEPARRRGRAASLGAR